MRLPNVLLAAIVVVPFLASAFACGGDDKTAGTSVQPSPTGSLTPTATGNNPPPPDTTSTSTGSTPPPPPPPPEPEWVPPVVATSSLGCGTAKAQPLGRELTTPAGRKLHVWGPPSYDEQTKYPVVLMFHGLGALGHEFQEWFEMEKYVEGKAFVVYGSAASKNDSWQVKSPTELAYFDELVKVLGDEYCINPSRILAFGFSWGVSMASQLACKRAGYVKALANGDGSWGGGEAACGRLPVLHTHRTKDNNEYLVWGQATEKLWASYNKCAVSSTPGDAAMNCTTRSGCKAPGSVTFCEDTWFDDGWPASWNHTVREPYRLYTWKWFDALP